MYVSGGMIFLAVCYYFAPTLTLVLLGVAIVGACYKGYKDANAKESK